MTDISGTTLPRIKAVLDASGLAYEVWPCDDSLADTAAFCAHYNVPLANSVNAILVRSKTDPAQMALCMVPATHRLDVNRTVRKRLGAKKASFAPPEDTRALTGMEIGGVTPIGLPPGLPVWVEASFLDSNGFRVRQRFEGLWGISLLHQIDHLNGRMYFDNLSRVKRDMLLRRAAKAG